MNLIPPQREQDQSISHHHLRREEHDNILCTYMPIRNNHKSRSTINYMFQANEIKRTLWESGVYSELQG